MLNFLQANNIMDMTGLATLKKHYLSGICRERKIGFWENENMI